MKSCAEELAPVISHIFQLSLETGSLPTDWRNANISPIFKKGDKHTAANYRPISLTCVGCKLLEHITCRHVLKHLERNKILTPLQHGFCSGHSCESQLIITMHDIIKSFDIKKQVDLEILDFSKAFDTVPHHKLLHKLTSYGIDLWQDKPVDKSIPNTSPKSCGGRRIFVSVHSRLWSATRDCSRTLDLPVPHK